MLTNTPEAPDIVARLDRMTALLEHQAAEVAQLRAALELARHSFSVGQLTMLNPAQRRNVLPNDSAALQKLCLAAWGAHAPAVLDHRQLLGSGFRVFSQGDEDGILLRIFTQAGTNNSVVIEIGSNCDGADLDIPENLSTNLIINHGWHGVVMEMDSVQCSRIRHFFAQNPLTKHFHSETASGGYISPVVANAEVRPDNINALLEENLLVREPDLMIIDIDGGDFAVMESMTSIQPRVLVVEFERRFRDAHSVVQRSRADFSQRFAQSGAASLPAWIALLETRGYVLVSIAATGFNAFFVRADVAEGSFHRATAKAVFDDHPVFANTPHEGHWLEPDDSWTQY